MQSGDILKHYKGGLYSVISIATHSETLKELVVYKNIADNRVWVRPIEMFYEEVEYKGKWVMRFEKCESFIPSPPEPALKPRTIQEGFDFSWLKSLLKMKKKKS